MISCMRPIAKHVVSYLQAERASFVDFVSRLAEKESPSDQPDTLQPVFDQLAEALDALDYTVEHLPGQTSGGHLFAHPTKHSSDVNQLLLGHCDTVWPIGTLDTMPVVQRNGILAGPGTYDMKAGVTMMLFALRTLQHFDIEPEVAPILLLTSDEEIGSAESRPHIERLAQATNRTFVLEPALGRQGKIKTARKGCGNYEITIQGKAAHAGLAPEEGASAILEMSYVIQRLFALNEPARGVTVNVGTLDGGIRPNVIAPKSRIAIDVRVPTQADAVRIDEAIRTLQPSNPEVQLHVTGEIDRPPLERTPRNRKLWQVGQRLGDELDLALEEGLAGGASDGNITSAFTATLDGLGAVGDGAHAHHEHIRIDETLQRCTLLTLLLLEPPLDHPV